jgi:Small, acid-soluble spore proteins, alpha/beta type
MAGNKKTLVPEARGALDDLKFEVADELGVPLKEGDNGDIKARDAGKIGGSMVRELIREGEKNISAKRGTNPENGENNAERH